MHSLCSPSFVILERIFAHYFPEIREIAKLKVFVDMPDGVGLTET